MAVQIHTYQGLENFSLLGNLDSFVLMNPKKHRGKVSQEAFTGVMWDNSLRFYICGLSGQHPFGNYDIPIKKFAGPCRVSSNTIVSIPAEFF